MKGRWIGDPLVVATIQMWEGECFAMGHWQCGTARGTTEALPQRIVTGAISATAVTPMQHNHISKGACVVIRTGQLGQNRWSEVVS